jgi:hypothetical protein
MDIRFVSSLSDADEEALAAALSAALGALLEETSLNYALRIQTSSRRVYTRQSRQAPSDRRMNETERDRSSLSPSSTEPSD